MGSNLLIFLTINCPQYVKSTAKFGGRLVIIWGRLNLGGEPVPPPSPAWNRHSQLKSCQLLHSAATVNASLSRAMFRVTVDGHVANDVRGEYVA